MCGVCAPPLCRFLLVAGFGWLQAHQGTCVCRWPWCLQPPCWCSGHAAEAWLAHTLHNSALCSARPFTAACVALVGCLLQASKVTQVNQWVTSTCTALVSFAVQSCAALLHRAVQYAASAEVQYPLHQHLQGTSRWQQAERPVALPVCEGWLRYVSRGAPARPGAMLGVIATCRLPPGAVCVLSEESALVTWAGCLELLECRQEGKVGEEYIVALSCSMQTAGAKPRLCGEAVPCFTHNQYLTPPWPGA